jgi:hypothetical protein
MEFLRCSGPSRTKLISVVIRPAWNLVLSPLNSLERGGLRLRMVHSRWLPPKDTRQLELPLLPGIGAFWRTHES